MSTVTEIESAIEGLDAAQFEELTRWLKRYARTRSDSLAGKKRDAIRETAGRLNEEDAEDFARAVAEAGRDVPDAHEW